MDTNRDSAHQSQNEDNFPTFSLGLEFLNEAEKEKNNGKGDCPRVKCNKFWQIDTLVVCFSRRIWCEIPPAML